MNSSEKALNPETKTGRAHILILEVLSSNPDGIRWADLARAVLAKDATVHPKTLNGCIWKLAQTFPDKVTKTDEGLFKLG